MTLTELEALAAGAIVIAAGVLFGGPPHAGGGAQIAHGLIEVALRVMGLN